MKYGGPFGLTADTIMAMADRARRKSLTEFYALLALTKRWREQEEFDRIVAEYMASAREKTNAS